MISSSVFARFVEPGGESSLGRVLVVRAATRLAVCLMSSPIRVHSLLAAVNCSDVYHSSALVSTMRAFMKARRPSPVLSEVRLRGFSTGLVGHPARV